MDSTSEPPAFWHGEVQRNNSQLSGLIAETFDIVIAKVQWIVTTASSAASLLRLLRFQAAQCLQSA